MRIFRLYLRNFRNIEEQSFDFSPRVNEVVGQNGQGKTTLLEAIFSIMTGGSFRTQSMEEMIRHETDGFFLECDFEKEGIQSQIQLSFDGQKRRILSNGKSCDSVVHLLGKLLGVMCAPDVHELIKGGPRGRRYFLDFQLAALDPQALHHFSRFKRALKQRNTLLRAKSEKTMEIWEEELAISSAYITKKRLKLVQELLPLLERFSEHLLGQKLSMKYITKVDPEATEEAMRHQFIEEMKRKRSQEMLYAATLVGPHRDDFELTRKGVSVHDFSSEGELRLAALSLKFAEWHWIKEKSSDEPLMLIDDFAAFLDQERQGRLFQLSSELGQLFLTAHTPQESFLSRKTFVLSSGQLVGV